MRLLDTLRGQRGIASLEDYAAALSSFAYNGSSYALTGSVQQTLQGSPAESIPTSFAAYANAARANGVVYACLLARMDVFSSARFAFQRIAAGRPSELWGNRDLRVLEEPHVGGTTSDLLSRMIQDADLAGNSYHVRDGDRILRLRPDWVSLLMTRDERTGTYDKQAYIYEEGGPGNGPLRYFWPEEVAHFAPTPDPLASYRGMSWLTPVLREVAGDNQIREHKTKFFANAATPNLAVVLDSAVDPVKFERFRELFEQRHRGADNAGKTLFLGGGADVTVVGTDFKQMDLKAIQGHGETRIVMAARVPPIIIGSSEGLDAATYSNYGQARRAFGDGTIHPLWRNAAATMGRIVPAPPGSRLWYDSRDVPFLREDEKDAAEIAFLEAQTMRQLIEAGYQPESVQRAVTSGDFGLLAHSGLTSVQLQPPGSAPTAPATTDEEPADAAS